MKIPSATDHVIYLDTETPVGLMRLAARACTANEVSGPTRQAANSPTAFDPHCDDTVVALSGAWFLDQSDLPAPSHAWRQDTQHPILRQAQTELTEWFAGQRREFDVALAPQGTPFQQAVWQALLDLSFGTTCSYSDLASAIGKPKSFRAAAQAIGRNPISIFIPCHRVVGRDSSLTGFGGGLPRKQALLQHEGHRYPGHHARVRRIDNSQLALPWQ